MAGMRGSCPIWRKHMKEKNWRPESFRDAFLFIPTQSRHVLKKRVYAGRQAGIPKIWDAFWQVLLKGFKFGGCNKIIDGKQERIAVGFGEALYLKSMLA